MKSMYRKRIDGEITSIDYNNYCAINNGFENYNEFNLERLHQNRVQQSMSENKKCPQYLGIYIGEKYLSKIWNSLVRMPLNNPYFDWICGRGFKIQGKAVCVTEQKQISSNGCENCYDVLQFGINRNKVADYFILLAFDNRDDLNPIKIWLFKGTDIVRGRKFSEFMKFGISMSKADEFKNYELIGKLEKLKECCNIVKGELL